MHAQLSTLVPDTPFLPQPVLPGVAPQRASSTKLAGRRRVARGHVLFDSGASAPGAFCLVEGEIVIMRRGLAIDLVEAGEYVDVSMWSGNTTAVARTDCTLAV